MDKKKFYANISEKHTTQKTEKSLYKSQTEKHSTQVHPINILHNGSVKHKKANIYRENILHKWFGKTPMGDKYRLPNG